MTHGMTQPEKRKLLEEIRELTLNDILQQEDMVEISNITSLSDHIANKMDASKITTVYVNDNGTTTMPDGTYILIICKAQYSNGVIWLVQSNLYSPQKLGGNSQSTLTVTKSGNTLTLVSEYGTYANWMFIRV